MTRVIALCLFLVACNSAPKPSPVPKVVQVPVVATCVPKVPEKPILAAEVVSLDSPIFPLVQALLISLEQLKGENAELRAALEGCAK